MGNDRILDEVTGKLVDPNAEKVVNFASTAMMESLTERIEDLEDKVTNLTNKLGVVTEHTVGEEFLADNVKESEDVVEVEDLPNSIVEVANEQNLKDGIKDLVT